MGNKDNQWGLHDFEKYTYTNTKDIKTYINCLLNENKITFFSVLFSKLGTIKENLLNDSKSL